MAGERGLEGPPGPAPVVEAGLGPEEVETLAEALLRKELGALGPVAQGPSVTRILRDAKGRPEFLVRETAGG